MTTIAKAEATPEALALDGENGRLSRSLRPRHVEMIAIGGIIGAGLFVGSSTAIAGIGPAAIVSYIVAGGIVMLVMRMLAEMATAEPGVQSFPEFARLGLGDWAGFMSGWLYWYFWVVVVAIEAIAGTTILAQWWPGLSIWQVAALLTIALAGTNLLSARSYGEFEFWLSGLKIAAILVFILVGLAYVTGVFGTNAGLGNWTAHGGFSPKGLFAPLAGVTSVIFALVGAEIATIAAAESDAGPRIIARMTFTVAIRILLFYVLSIALIVAVVPWNEILPGQSPFAAAIARMGIPGGAMIMQAVVLIAVLSCLNSGLYVTSRVLHSLALRGDAPAALRAVSGPGVPRRAIIFSTIFSLAALAVAIVSPDTAFAFLVNASGAIMLVLYLLIAFAQLRLRMKMEREARRPVLSMWLHPWGSIATIGAIAAVLITMAIDPDLQSQFQASSAAVAIVLVGWAARRSNLLT